MRKFFGVFMAMVFALSLCALPICSIAESDEIVIGSIQDLTSWTASLGIPAAWGSEYAVRLVNEAGGINGKTIKFVSMDCALDVQTGINVYRRLVDEHNAVAIIGPPLSNIGIALAPLAVEDQVPIVGTFMDERATTNEATGEPWGYMFLTSPSCSQESTSNAKHGMEQLGLKTFATIYQKDLSYAVKQAEPFMAYVIENGGSIVAEEHFQADDKDFRAQIAKIVAANPEAVFVPNYELENALIYDQLREAGFDGVILGADTFMDPFQSLCKMPVKDVYFAQFIDPDSEECKEIFRVYLEETKSDYSVANVALGYDAMMVVIEALKKVDDPHDGEALARALSQTKDVMTASGPMSIDPATNRTTGLPIYICTHPEEIGAGYNYIYKVYLD